MIELQKLCAGYTGHNVLQDVSLTFTPGKVTVLLGPNGCGKSTLLRTVLGFQPKLSGRIMIDGVPLEELTPRSRAQKVAYLAQSRSIPNITARRMVLHGRFPHLSYPRRCRREDHESVERALRMMDAEELAERSMQELSGGQRQKVYLAMALAQDTQTILMDEPTTYLDIGHQLEVMALSRRLAEEGRAVVLVMHDLCQAMQTADEAAVLSGGRLLFAGAPEDAFAEGVLDRVFGISLRRFRTESGWQYYYGHH